MKSSNALGRCACLLAVAALAMACGGGGGSGTTTGTGGAGNGTGGTTTGTGCIHVGESCAAGSCCGGLTCNAAKFCVGTQSTTGTGSGGTGTGGAFVDPCLLGDAGAACATSIECEPGLLCADGTCFDPAVSPPKPACTARGIAPAAGAPCCESTQDAGPAGLSCESWVPCITQGSKCGAGDTCCDALTCGSDGTCDPVCGAIGSACTTDGDCCGDQGIRCIPGSTFTAQVPPIPGNICYPYGRPEQLVPNSVNGQFYYCADFAQCLAYDAGVKEVIDCQLGAFCDPGIPEDGGTDTCAQDGLVCDVRFKPGSVCRNPDLFDPCVAGGPACNPQADSTSPIVCSDPIFGQLGTVTLCTYECQTTADCVEPWLSCVATNNPADEDCAFNEQTTGCEQNTPGDLLGPCNAASVSDGICLALGGETPSNSFGLCTQAFTDGDGGPGAPCNFNGNRQLGGLCDTSDLCAGNVCGPICNAGTTKTPACGAGQTCLALMDVDGINVGPDPTVDAYTTGACVTPCDFTLQDAGPCVATSQGVPTKCLPAESLGYAPKAQPDFCMAGPTAAEAIPIGGNCANAIFGNALDPCVDGAECLGGNFGTPAICQQLCEDSAIGKKGPPACPAGDTCTGINFTGAAASTHTGYCAPATDGG